MQKKHAGRSKPMVAIFKLETNQYFFKSDNDIFQFFFSPIFGRLPIFDWPSIPIFQNLLTDIFSDILTVF